MKKVNVPAARRLPSGSWFIQVRMGGRSKSFTGDTAKEVEAEALAYKLGLAQEQEARVYPTLTVAIDNYLEARSNTLSPSTIRGYKTIQRTRFQPWMQRKLHEMKKKDWQAACNQEARLCSAKSLSNAWRFLSGVIYETTGERIDVRLPQIVPNERPFLTPDQINIFTEAIKGKPVEIPALLALSSLRRSEICALRWKDIDLKNRLIHVNGAVVPDENHKIIRKKENKNRTSNRKVPIMMDQLLEALTDADKTGENVVTAHPTTICNQINRVCAANGLPLVGVHGLRHSFASLAYHLNVPEKVAMEIGGWADHQTMHKIYTHIAQSDISHYGSELAAFFNK